MPTRRNRHQRLRCKFCLPAKTLIKRDCNDFVGLEHYHEDPHMHCHSDDLFHCVELVALKHLEYEMDVNIADYVNGGISVWHDYFACPWWRRDDRMQGAIGHQDFPWFKEFKNGLLLASMGRDVDSYVTQACMSLHFDLDYTDSIDPDFDSGLPVFYLALAEVCRGRRIRGLQKRISYQKQTGSPRITKLLGLLEMFRSNRFNEFSESLALSLDGLQVGGSLPINWIAMEESIVVNLAINRGWAISTLPNEFEPLLVRRSSLGLEE